MVKVKYDDDLNKDSGNKDGKEMDSYGIGKISRIW